MKWYDIIFVIVSLIVIVLALLQGGKSEGASGAITGGGLNVFAKTKERGSEKVITYLTFGFAIVFLFIALLISVTTKAPTTDTDSSSAAIEAAAALPNFEFRIGPSETRGFFYPQVFGSVLSFSLWKSPNS